MKRIRRKLLYLLFGVVALLALGVFTGIQYFKSQWYRDRPNRLVIEGGLHPVPFEWSAVRYGDYMEPHNAILIPASIPGLKNKFYLQFDTGSPYTFVRSGVLEALSSRGIECAVIEEDGEKVVRRFAFDVGDNHVVLNHGRVMERDVSIDLDDLDATCVIGSIGTDFLDQLVCAIDFPAQELRLYAARPESFDSLGKFAPFSFKGRRIMLPAVIDGSEQELFYDSGCSAFGLLTSKYHFDRFTDPNVAETNYDANRFGDAIPVHHKPCQMAVQFGSIEMPLERVSYVEMYEGLQATFGRFSSIGGFLGNKCLTESSLILDTKASEFLVVRRSLQAQQNRARVEPGNGREPVDGSAEVSDWIKAAATILQPVQPSSGEQAYGSFEQAAATARVVGLGEATHGQHEVFDLKRRLTMHLIRNHGFRAVAYEASASRAIDADDYVAGRTNDRPKAISGLGMLIWQVEENGQLLDDLREWNRSAKQGDRVRFFGCDAQNGPVIVSRLALLLGDQSPNGNSEIVATQLTGLLDRCEAATGKAHAGDRTDLDKLLADAEAVAVGIRDHAREVSRDAAVQVMLEVDLRLKEFAAHLGLYGEVGARDKVMAELLLMQLNALSPQAKCIVWGHNAHVQRSVLSYLRSENLAMGGHLAAALGKGYYALGVLFGSGEFQANVLDVAGKWRFRRYTHSAAPAGSLGRLLGDAVAKDFLLDFRSAPQSPSVQSWLHSSYGHRWWGGYNVPDDFDERTSHADNLSQCVPGVDYDAIAFIYRTSAARPVNAALIESR